MSRSKFLAVRDDAPEDFYIEDSPAAVAFAMRNAIAIKFYPISVDSEGNPVIGEEATWDAMHQEGLVGFRDKAGGHQLSVEGL